MTGKAQKTIVIIVGAGKGRRIGFKDKAFLMINKKPVLFYSILPFEKSDLINQIILVVKKEKIKAAESIVKKYKFRKVKKIVSGGKERQDSVYNGLKSLDLVPGEEARILIHDAARPLVSRQLIKKCAIAAKKFGAAIPAVLARDTVKEGGGFVKKTLNRDKLWLVQTPQAFRCDILKRAHDMAQKEKFYETDDASLVERLGYKIKVIAGDYRNIKITMPVDLIVAKALLSNK